MATNAEILAAIDTAIVDILQNGQTVTFEGDTYDKANITSLFKQREKFTRKTSSMSSFFDRRKTIIPGRS